MAVTIEVLGPLVLSVALSRRPVAWLWALLAFTGIAILGLAPDRAGHLDWVGISFAAAAAVSWSGYILASSKAAQLFPRLDAVAVALMSSVIPYSLELWSLRTLASVGAVRSARGSDRLPTV